uniref:uncharacterized protein LOC118537085 isoform X2 n=1 Tax=Halichoerus grypus TaxID=9711 RepID=UPI001659A04F|nr:uncharacterized protein LOC118537085 isoform X2 [Halichoerus grypus]XP_035950343.1 uncharacterized protein LOC118537085 isoform X2 [Halichoerus grypus]
MVEIKNSTSFQDGASALQSLAGGPSARSGSPPLEQHWVPGVSLSCPKSQSWVEPWPAQVLRDEGRWQWKALPPGPERTLDPDPGLFLRKHTLCLLNLELEPHKRSILNLGAGGNQQHPPHPTPVALGRVGTGLSPRKPDTSAGSGCCSFARLLAQPCSPPRRREPRGARRLLTWPQMWGEQRSWHTRSSSVQVSRADGGAVFERRTLRCLQRCPRNLIFKPGSQTCKLKDDSREMVSFGWLQQPDGRCSFARNNLERACVRGTQLSSVVMTYGAMEQDHSPQIDICYNPSTSLTCPQLTCAHLSECVCAYTCACVCMCFALCCFITRVGSSLKIHPGCFVDQQFAPFLGK